MAYLFLASILASCAALRLWKRARRSVPQRRPAAVERMIELLERSDFAVRPVAAGMVSHGAVFQFEADFGAMVSAFGDSEPVRLRVLATASNTFGGQVGVEWIVSGSTVAHRDVMRQLGRATVDWRAGVGGRGVVVDPAGLRIEPFLFDLAEVVLPILREEPGRLAAAVRAAVRRRLGPAVGRGLRAF